MDMKKETLLLSYITSDLKTVAKFQMSNVGEWRFSYIIPITLLSVIIGVLLKSIWVALLIFSVAAYHIVRYTIEYRDYSMKKKAVVSAVDRADVSVSVEHLSHINSETVYEPHRGRTRGHATKTATYYYFESGSRWRVPSVDKHYSWSKEYYISSKGLENISIKGDEFYLVSLQGYPDIAYIYPCKSFELGGELKK